MSLESQCCTSKLTLSSARGQFQFFNGFTHPVLILLVVGFANSKHSTALWLVLNKVHQLRDRRIL